MNTPKIILADEPTGNVDSRAGNEITNLLKELNQDQGIAGKLVNHYEAFVHQVNFALIPGIGTWAGECNGGGTCTATSQALRVPFALLFPLPFHYCHRPSMTNRILSPCGRGETYTPASKGSQIFFIPVYLIRLR